MNIGEKLREAREELSFEMREVSKLTGIPIPTLYGYENGNIKNIPHEKLNTLANLYAKDIGFFVETNDEKIKLAEDRELLNSLLRINDSIILQLTNDQTTVNEIKYYLLKRVKRFLDSRDL